MKDKALAQFAPAMFKKVLNGSGDINERIFIIQILRQAGIYNRIPTNDKNRWHEREIPFINIDLVHLLFNQCIQYFTNQMFDLFKNNNNNNNNNSNNDENDNISQFYDECIKICDTISQLCELCNEYVRDQSEHTQKSWLHLIIDVINKNINNGTILADYQRRKTSELETPGNKKVLLAGGNKKVRNITNPYHKKKKGNDNNDNKYKNNNNNNNNNNNSKNQRSKHTSLPPESEDIKQSKISSIMSSRGCDYQSASNYYESVRLKPCWPYNQTGLCRKNIDCWFGHFCKTCGGPHPACNCPK